VGWLTGWSYRKSHVIVPTSPTGTISVTNGSSTVTGSGTNFTKWLVGDQIKLPDGNWYTIASIVSNTSLTITVNYPGASASGQSYEMKHINYQIYIKAHYGSGTDSGADIYLNSHCRTDFGDVGFTTSDGTTLLDYWMESKVDSDNAVFWVEVAEIPASCTIYVYYGKSDATTTSNGDNTFNFFDDFPGTSLDLTKWDVVAGTPTVDSSILTCTGAEISSDVAFARPLRIRGKARFNTNNYFGQLVAMHDYVSGTKYFQSIFRHSATPLWRSETNNGGTVDKITLTAPTIGTYYIWEANWITTYVKVYQDNALIANHTLQIPDANLKIRVLSSGNNPELNVDWIFISKFVDPEPSHGAWGSEETGGATTYTKTYTADVLFQKLGITKTYTTDTLFQKQGLTKTYTIDAILKKIGLKQYQIDALLQKLGIPKTYTIDSLFKKPNITTTYNIDTLLKKTGLTKNYTIDALLKKLNLTKDYPIDSLFKKLGVTKTYTVDTVFQAQGVNTYTKTYTIDALLKKLGITTSYSIDTLFKKLGLTKTYTVDSLFQKQNLTKTYTIDTLLKKSGLTKTYTIDALLKKLGLKQYQIDALFQKLGLTKTYTIDSTFVLRQTKTYTLDTLLKKLNITQSYTIDTIIGQPTPELPFGGGFPFWWEKAETWAPSLFNLFRQERTYYQTQIQLARKETVKIPAQIQLAKPSQTMIQAKPVLTARKSSFKTEIHPVLARKEKAEAKSMFKTAEPAITIIPAEIEMFTYPEIVQAVKSAKKRKVKK